MAKKMVLQNHERNFLELLHIIKILPNSIWEFKVAQGTFETDRPKCRVDTLLVHYLEIKKANR